LWRADRLTPHEPLERTFPLLITLLSVHLTIPALALSCRPHVASSGAAARRRHLAAELDRRRTALICAVRPFTAIGAVARVARSGARGRPLRRVAVNVRGFHAAATASTPASGRAGPDNGGAALVG